VRSQAKAPSPRPAAIEKAADVLRAGGLVVFPTETLYGIGCDALDPAALERLRAAKERPEEKGLLVLVSDLAMVETVARDISRAARRLCEKFWPGPLTVLFPARDEIPPPLVVDGKVAARLSSDPFAQALVRALGRPVAAPSANRSGEPPAADVATARRTFGERVGAYLDDGLRSAPPSTLADPGPPLRVLRDGPISRAALEAALADHPGRA
jgi:L-threonylcarbamoyladenylate synthase